jgi:hypothetical protein
VVSFTPQPLYSRAKSPRYPLDMRLGGPQNRSGRRGEQKIPDPTGIRTLTPPSSNPDAVPTALSWIDLAIKYSLKMEVVRFSETLVPLCQPHGVAYQKTVIFIVTVARISNLLMIDVLSVGNSQYPINPANQSTFC